MVYEAFRVLSNPAARKVYDKKVGSAGRSAGPEETSSAPQAMLFRRVQQQHAVLGGFAKDSWRLHPAQRPGAALKFLEVARARALLNA